MAESKATSGDTRITCGDILYWPGSGWISGVIKRFDGSPFSHVSLATSSFTHIEAAAVGVVEKAFLIEDGMWVKRPEVEKEYRWESVIRARKYTGRPYAFNSLVMLAAVLEARKAGWPWYLKWMKWPLIRVATGGGKKTLICSELVYRSYRDAGVNLLTDDPDPDIVTPAMLWTQVPGTEWKAKYV